MAVTFKIHPAIGVARFGSCRNPAADGYFCGPNFPGQRGIEFTPQGQPAYIEKYKDANGDIKRQGARFRVFKYEDGHSPVEVTPQIGSVKWQVTLANTKGSTDHVGNGEPKSNFEIFPKFPEIEGNNKVETETVTGKFLNTPVPLGELRTDGTGRLIVLGGLGRSASPNNRPIEGLYNKGWYDDASDGSVDASITIGGQEYKAVGAWVIVGPPDFAPLIDPLVSLYDIARDIAVKKGWLQKPVKASLYNDIYPLIRSAQGMTWVEERYQTFWKALHDFPGNLFDPSPAAKQFRKEMHDALNAAPAKFSGGVAYTDLQEYLLNLYEEGDFVNDFHPAPTASDIPTPEDLDAAALSACVGASFSPGIEASKIMNNPEIYSEAFRLDPTKVRPGDLTRDLSLPWQADFMACAASWWPAQRPSSVYPNASSSSKVAWTRGVTDGTDLVKNFSRLGFIERNTYGSFDETERDPTLPPEVPIA